MNRQTRSLLRTRPGRFFYPAACFSVCALAAFVMTPASDHAAGRTGVAAAPASVVQVEAPRLPAPAFQAGEATLPAECRVEGARELLLAFGFCQTAASD
jgi:hypothetical protein